MAVPWEGGSACRYSNGPYSSAGAAKLLLIDSENIVNESAPAVKVSRGWHAYRSCRAGHDSALWQCNPCRLRT